MADPDCDSRCVPVCEVRWPMGLGTPSWPGKKRGLRGRGLPHAPVTEWRSSEPGVEVRALWGSELAQPAPPDRAAACAARAVARVSSSMSSPSRDSNATLFQTFTGALARTDWPGAIRDTRVLWSLGMTTS